MLFDWVFLLPLTDVLALYRALRSGGDGNLPADMVSSVTFLLGQGDFDLADALDHPGM